MTNRRNLFGLMSGLFGAIGFGRAFAMAPGRDDGTVPPVNSGMPAKRPGDTTQDDDALGELLMFEHLQDGRLHHFVAHIAEGAALSGAYRFTLTRNGRSGRTSNAQAGRIKGEGDLFRASVSIDEGDEWRADLALTLDGGERIVRTLSSDQD